MLQPWHNDYSRKIVSSIKNEKLVAEVKFRRTANPSCYSWRMTLVRASMVLFFVAVAGCSGSEAPSNQGQKVGTNVNAADGKNTAGGTALNITCTVSYRPSTASPDNTGLENWDVRALTDSRTFAFDKLTLHAEVLPSSTVDDVALRFEVPQSNLVHEFHLPGQPGIRTPQTGLIYAEHPTDDAEVQFSCTRLVSSLPNAPSPSTTGAICTVTESKDGEMERSEHIPVTVIAPASVEFRGGTFHATLMSVDEEGLVVGVGWQAPPTRQTGISQLLRTTPIGDKPFTVNQLGTSMTGVASVRTPAGTDISYVCEAQ